MRGAMPPSTIYLHGIVLNVEQINFTLKGHQAL